MFFSKIIEHNCPELEEILEIVWSDPLTLEMRNSLSELGKMTAPRSKPWVLGRQGTRVTLIPSSVGPTSGESDLREDFVSKWVLPHW